MKDRTAQHAYRKRMSQDMPSNMACLTVIGSMLLAVTLLVTLMIPGSQISHRAAPLYWAIVIPFTWWAVNLAYYDARFTWSLLPATLIAPSIAFGCVVVALLHRTGAALPLGITLACVVLSGVGYLFYRRSLLMRDRSLRRTTGSASADSR